MKVLNFFSILLVGTLIINSCSRENEESLIKKDVSNFEKVSSLKKDGLTYVSKNVKTKLKNERLNKLIDEHMVRDEFLR